MLKPVSTRLQKRIIELGGLNEHGEPLFRVVRGRDEFSWVGGTPWVDRDANGNVIREVYETRRVPKYPEALDRYILETWIPPEHTEREWEQLFTVWVDGHVIELMGPFPRHGTYEPLKVLETPTTKQFVPLTETICDALVTTAKANRDLSLKMKLEFIRERREREEAAKEQRLIDRIDEMAPAFEGRPSVVVPSVVVPSVVVPSDAEISKYSNQRMVQ